MIKLCKICGGEYCATSNSQRYCSPKCLEQGSIQYYQRKFQSFDRECIWCGNKFFGTEGAKWCSDACKKGYQYKELRRRQKERQDRLKYASDGICKYCGRSFKGTKLQKYCSEECRCESMRKFNRDKAILLFEEGKNLREIAKELGAGVTTVRRALKQRGFDTSKNYIRMKKNNV